MKPILKIIIPICFLGLIGVFVLLNSNWYDEPAVKPKPVQKTTKPVEVKTPVEQQTSVAETPDAVKQVKTKRSKEPVAEEGIELSEEETRQLIMSSSKSMKVAPTFTPDTSPAKFKLEPSERTTIMPSTKSAPVRFDSPFIAPRKKK